MFYRILENLFVMGVNAISKKMPKCENCHTVMENPDQPLLFLIPVFHDEVYTPSVEYYKKHCTLIHSTEQIPLGQRACKFWILTCPKCYEHKVLVEDFLKVRDEEVIELRELYDYNALVSFLNYPNNDEQIKNEGVQQSESTDIFRRGE